MHSSPHICLGLIASAHGLKGEVKIRSFTEFPEDIASYGPLHDEARARSFTIESYRMAGEDMLIARLKGVTDRTQAEKLQRVKLYVERDALPDAEEGEYYRADLIGLRVEDASGTVLGRVLSVENYGAGDIFIIEKTGGEEWMLPFTEEIVPQVDIAGGRILVEVPEELVVEEGKE